MFWLHSLNYSAVTFTVSPCPACWVTYRALDPHPHVLEEPSVDWGSGEERKERKERKWNSGICHGPGQHDKLSLCALYSARCLALIDVHTNTQKLTTDNTKYARIVTKIVIPSIVHISSTNSSQFWIMPPGLITMKLWITSYGVSFPSTPLPYLPHQMKTGLASLCNHTAQ